MMHQAQNTGRAPPRDRRRSRLRAILLLLRIENVLCVIPAVLLGAMLAEGLPGARTEILRALAAAVAGACICAFGNVLNDYCDIEIDRINVPSRPLPAGDLAPASAIRLALLLLAAGLVSAALLGPVELVVAGALALGACLYAVRLKRTLAGHALVGGLTAMTSLYGGLVAGRIAAALWPALLIFLAITARELLKAAEDRAGDAAHGARTAATVFGPRAAAYLFVAGSAGLMLVALAPYLAGAFGRAYLLATLLAFYPTTLLAMRGAIVAAKTGRYRTPLLLSKAGLMLGLAVMFLGALT